MHITNQTNYALRILMYCGLRGGELSKVATIAAQYQISETYLFKILPVLVNGDLIESVRGRNGGIRLRHDASTIRVGDVFRVTEDRVALAECFEEPSAPCPLLDTCKLHSVWSEAYEAFVGVLDRYTIADLIERDRVLAKRLGLELGLAS